MLNIALISLYGIENNGIRSISSVLKAAGFNTYVIFLKRWLNNDICHPTQKENALLLSLLKELNIGLVGISFTSPFVRIARDMTRQIKDNLPAKVVWGGIHATVKPHECLEYCDIVCRGEGEYAMLDIARALAAGRTLKGVGNACYKDAGAVVLERMRPLIQDLDLLPAQDYGSDNKFFIEGALKNEDPLVNTRELRVFASRGCPFNCSYCYNSIFRKLYAGQNYYRIKSVGSVMAEVECALSNFKNIREIKFDDDTFIFPKRWIDEFCKSYKNRIGLPFGILFNAECLDRDVLIQLKGAGLRRLQVGIQTGSRRESQEVYNRNLPSERIRRFSTLSNVLGLDVVYDIILDNPLAKLEDKLALIEILLTFPRPFSLFLYSLTVFPGTDLCGIFLKKGLIRPQDIEGEATKSFYQFRLNLSYPRKKEDLFIACIVSLTSKSFIPRPLISFLKENSFLRKHPAPLKWTAQVVNNIKLACVLLKMLREGSLNLWKFKEYGLPRRFLIQ